MDATHVGHFAFPGEHQVMPLGGFLYGRLWLKQDQAYSTWEWDKNASEQDLHPQSLTWNLKMMVSIGISFSSGWFSGSMFNSRGVYN